MKVIRPYLVLIVLSVLFLAMANIASAETVPKQLSLAGLYQGIVYAQDVETTPGIKGLRCNFDAVSYKLSFRVRQVRRNKVRIKFPGGTVALGSSRKRTFQASISSRNGKASHDYTIEATQVKKSSAFLSFNDAVNLDSYGTVCVFRFAGKFKRTMLQ